MSDLPKILITGGSGLIGTRIKQLLSTKYQFLDASLETGVDLLDDTQLKEFLDTNTDAQALVHLAAYTDVKKAQEQQNDKSGICYQLNTLLTEKLAKHCQKHNIHLIYLSTAYVFDGTIPADKKYSEDDTPNPIGWYAQTKYFGEQMIHEHQPPHTIVRIDFPYGHKFGGKTDWVWAITNRLQQEQLYPMFTDQWQTPIFIDDIAQTIHKLTIHPAGNQILHIAPKTNTTPYDSAKLIASQLNISPDSIKPGKFSDYQSQNPEAASLLRKNVTLDSTKASQIYHITFTEFTTGLKQIFS